MKKWSYVTALMLAASTGCVFTGCIDNDEPFGIEQIRVATAELLKAKKDAVAAEAAAANAAVEVEKIKAEIEKQRLENEKAKAEAEAKIQQLLAEAEAAKTQAEADILKAQAEAIRLAAEMDAKDRQAQIDRYIAATQDEIRNADLAYEKAVAAWEAMKIKYAENKSDKLYAALEDAYGSYLRQIENYNNLNTQYLLANQKSSEYQNDLVWDEEANGGKGGFVSPNRDQEKILTNQIAYLENEIAKSQKEIDDVNEFNTKLEAANASELGQLLAEYEEKQKANDEALVKLDVKKQLAIEENEPLLAEVKQLEAKANELADAEITIPAVEIPAVPSLPRFQQAQTIVDETTYRLGDDNAYTNAINVIQANITNLNKLMLDENDKLWTQASLNELQRQYAELTGENGAWTQLEAAWTLAKKVYNMGGTPDASVLPDADKVDASIEAFNTAVEAIAPLREAMFAANEEKEAAGNAVNEALDAYGQNPNNQSNQYDALIAARDEFDLAQPTAEAARDEADNQAYQAYYKEINKNLSLVNQANKAAEAAQDILSALTAQLEVDPNNADLKKEVKAAEEDLAKKQAAATKAEETAIAANQAAWQSCQKTVAANLTAYVKAVRAAETAWYKAQADYYAYVASNGDEAAYAPVVAAQNAWKAADDKATAANEALEAAVAKAETEYTALGAAISAQEDAIGFVYRGNSYQELSDALYSYAYGDGAMPVAQSPMMEIEQGVYYNAKYYLIAKSRAAYGSLLTSYDPENGYSLYDQAFLVDAVTPTMVDDYIKNYLASNNYEIPAYEYYNWYWMFGAYGDVLYLQHDYEMAEAYLGNNDIITSIVNGLKADLAEMEKTQLAAEKASEDATKAYEAKAEEYTYNTQGVFADEEGQLKSQGIIYGDIIASLETAVAKIEMGEDSMEIVKDMIETNETKLENAQARIDYLNKLLADANYQLAQYQNGTVDYSINPYKYEAESLKALVDAAKEALAVAKARVEYLQSKYEASTK